MKFRLPVFLLIAASAFVSKEAAAQGEFSGNFQSNTQFYLRDDRIGANTTQYLREKSSADAWLYMNYKIKGFSLIARYDVFNNSPLLNPQAAYTNSGLGFWSVKKQIDKLTITGGYFYDQFGSGTIFRAFEDRLIGIDYAVRGAHVHLQINDKWFLKAFTGQQKGYLDLDGTDTRFNVSPQVVKGINSERRFEFGKYSLDLGISGVNRTLDSRTVNSLVNEINALPLEKRFSTYSNTYLGGVYYTLNLGRFAWMSEFVYKTKEALRDQLDQSDLYGSDGKVFMSSLSYSQKGLGINVQYKRVDNYQFRNSPNSQQLNGLIAYLPTNTRQNVYRLLARYTPVVQNRGENAYQADIQFTPKKWKKWNFNLNYSYIETLQKSKLYEEYYIEANYKISKKWKAALGFQSIFYSQAIYQLNPNAPDVKAYTPFTEVTYKINTRQSIRFEAQYMSTKMDLGSFVNALVEFNVAPHWSFSIGDMVNTDPVRTPETPQQAISKEQIHYYNVFASYTHKTTRFTANYLKQVQGVNCTGGICRVEPAFSGFRLGLTTNF